MKRFLLCFLLSLPALAHAQINLKKGYIVNNNKDTIAGFIDYRERDANPNMLRFTKNPKEKTTLYDLQSCAAFGMEGITSYERYIVNVSQSQENISLLSIGIDTTNIRDTVFLKVLRTGAKLTLYAYTDKIKTRFFVKERTAVEPKELIKRVYLNPESETNIVYNERFRLQLIGLNRLFYGINAADEEKINRIRYSESDLIRFTEKINQDKAIKSNFSKVRFFAGAGLNMTHSSYSGVNRLAEAGAVTKSSYLPMFSVGMDYLANPAIGRMVYRLEVNYAMSKANIYNNEPVGFTSHVGHTFDQYDLAIVPQILYHFYNKESVKVFFSVGAGLNFPTYKNNKSTVTNSFRKETDVYENQIEFQKFYYSFQGKAGLVLNKRFEFAAGYLFNAAVTNYTYYNVNLSRATLGLNYIFGR